jgi:hypothetical protein
MKGKPGIPDKNKKKHPAAKKAKRGETKLEEKLTDKTDVDTYDSWLGKQRDHGLEKGKFRSTTEGEMPKSSMQGWLGKQKVLEKPKTEEITMPVNSTEQWLRKQISDRVSKDKQEDKAAATASPPAAL